MQKITTLIEKGFDVFLIAAAWGTALYLMAGLLLVSVVEMQTPLVWIIIICGYFVIITLLIKYTRFWLRRWKAEKE